MREQKNSSTTRRLMLYCIAILAILDILNREKSFSLHIDEHTHSHTQSCSMEPHLMSVVFRTFAATSIFHFSSNCMGTCLFCTMCVMWVRAPRVCMCACLIVRIYAIADFYCLWENVSKSAIQTYPHIKCNMSVECRSQRATSLQQPTAPIQQRLF